MNEDIIAKLQKILAKADPARGATEAEANSAMAMAQRLAIQHNIDLASVTAADAPGTSSIETDRVDLDGDTATRRLHHIPAAQALMECFDVRFIWRGAGSQCVIIGEKTDVAIAAYCWPWLNTTYLELFRQFAKTHRSNHSENVQRRSYYHGLTSGIITNNRRQRAEAAAAPGGNCFALVIAKKEDAVNARVAEEFPDCRKARKARDLEWDGAAAYHGNKAGLQIRLNNGIAGPAATQPELALA